MKKIEVDNEVYAFLKEMAEPFVDTPNTVLRRLLLENESENDQLVVSDVRNNKSIRTRWAKDPDDRDKLISQIKETHFGGVFSRVGRYRFMFRSAKNIIYFQNFEKAGTSTLWYRVDQKAIDTLNDFGDGAFLIFTNPAENIAYIIPVAEVVRKMKECGWDREALEVNIDHVNSYWRELRWNIGSYYQEFND